MVARRRLKRPARRAAHLSPHRARVSLVEAAGVESVTPKVDREVEHMRDELTREDERREIEHDEEADDDADTEQEGEASVQLGQKVAGDWVLMIYMKFLNAVKYAAALTVKR